MENMPLSALKIERFVTRLYEVGDSLIEETIKIETKKKMIEIAKSEVRRLELEVENDRAFLTAKVLKNYSQSEIDEAIKNYRKK